MMRMAKVRKAGMPMREETAFGHAGSRRSSSRWLLAACMLVVLTHLRPSAGARRRPSILATTRRRDLDMASQAAGPPQRLLTPSHFLNLSRTESRHGIPTCTPAHNAATPNAVLVMKSDDESHSCDGVKRRRQPSQDDKPCLCVLKNSRIRLSGVL